MNWVSKIVNYVLGRTDYYKLHQKSCVESIEPYTGPITQDGTAVRVICTDGIRCIVALAPELRKSSTKSLDRKLEI